MKFQNSSTYIDIHIAIRILRTNLDALLKIRHKNIVN